MYQYNCRTQVMDISIGLYEKFRWSVHVTREENFTKVVRLLLLLHYCTPQHDMIEYSRGAYGANLLLRWHGSALAKAFIPVSLKICV